MSDDRARILVVDDVPENVRLLEAVLDAHGYDVVSADERPFCSRACVVGEAGPRAARRDDAAARRSRRLQAAPPAGGDGGPAGDHAHRERGLREDDGDRGGRGRLPPEAVQPRGASHPHPVAAPDQALPRHDQGSGCRAAGPEPDARRRACRRSSTSSNGCSGYVGSSRPSSRTRSSPRATNRSCAATVGRSRCSSPTCAAGRTSSIRSSPRS